MQNQIKFGKCSSRLQIVDLAFEDLQRSPHEPAILKRTTPESKRTQDLLHWFSFDPAYLLQTILEMKPIKLYSHALGPNPWKCVILMEELGIPYDAEFVDFSVIKQAPFTAVNPNGRVPAIHDANTDLTLWESGAIVTYLIDQYDKNNKLSYPQSDMANYHKTNQWLHFQASGQGPYFGQAAWFRNFHGEKIPSAIERYEKEVKRVTTVLDQHLAKTGSPYLVGDKCTYADLSFLPWINMMDILLEKDESEKFPAEFPHYTKWKETLFARPAVTKTFSDRTKAMENK